MDRRALLASCGAGVSLFITGCLNPDESGETTDDDDQPEDDRDMTDETTDDQTEPDSDDVDDTKPNSDDVDDTTADDADSGGIRGKQFEVTGKDGEFDESASVTIEDGAVTVTGTVSGNNSCYSARLEDVNLSEGELTVAVESYDASEPDEGCLEVIIGIHYEAIIDMDPPNRVVVTHNGEELAAAEQS